MIKHIVTFKLTGTPAERKEVANKFKDALMALPLTIDVLKSIEVGIMKTRPKVGISYLLRS